MIKGFATVAAAAALVAGAAGVSSATASKPKPLGYLYEQCSTKTTCSFEGSTPPAKNKVAVSETGLCETGAVAVSQAGYTPVKGNGKFSLKKTIKVEGGYATQAATVQVQLIGTLKPGKSVVGTLKITTTASDCTADTGVSKAFHLKYLGPTYGG